MSEPAQEFTANRVLVVGGAGFVGSNLVCQLLAAGAGEIVVIDNLLSAECRNIPSDERVSFVNGSITDDVYTILLDPAKTERDFDWKISTPLAQGIKEAVAYYHEHGITETFTHLKHDE